MALEQNAAAVHVSGDVLEDFVLIFRELLSKVIIDCAKETMVFVSGCIVLRGRDTNFAGN